MQYCNLDEIINCDIEKTRENNEKFHRKGIIENMKWEILKKYMYRHGNSYTKTLVEDYIAKSTDDNIEKLCKNIRKDITVLDKIYKVVMKMYNIKEDF